MRQYTGVDILQEDGRWKYGTPPNGNANFAWMQHMLYHLSPKGVMATVLSNGSLSSNTSGEGDIRKNLVEGDLVECIVALPKQLFYNTGIPACLWFLRREKNSHSKEILFIDATEMGFMKDRSSGMPTYRPGVNTWLCFCISCRVTDLQKPFSFW
jgi:type I restriction enzyme M protein